jgi:hypothetical protein
MVIPVLHVVITTKAVQNSLVDASYRQGYADGAREERTITNGIIARLLKQSSFGRHERLGVASKSRQSNIKVNRKGKQ